MQLKLDGFLHPPFPGFFVVYMPSCLHALLRVTCPLLGGGEGTITFGMFPWGCEGTIARRRLLFGGGDNFLGSLETHAMLACIASQLESW